MKTLFKNLLQRVKHGEADAEFIEEVRHALKDGILTDDERFWLLERHADLKAGDVTSPN
jgi:hypothetical protein